MKRLLLFIYYIFILVEALLKILINISFLIYIQLFNYTFVNIR